MIARPVAPAAEHPADSTITRQLHHVEQLRDLAYVDDTLAELEALHVRTSDVERAERCLRLIAYYRGRREALARELRL